MIKILLNTNFIMDGIAEKITGDLIHVADIRTDDLEEAFALSQNIDHQWYKNPGVGSIGDHKLMRSSSAGDVFETEDGKRYMVAMLGFKELPKE